MICGQPAALPPPGGEPRHGTCALAWTQEHHQADDRAHNLAATVAGSFLAAVDGGLTRWGSQAWEAIGTDALLRLRTDMNRRYQCFRYRGLV